MKELEDKVYILIGKNGKIKTAEMLGMTFSTLVTRLEKGRWRKEEIEIIESLTD